MISVPNSQARGQLPPGETRYVKMFHVRGVPCVVCRAWCDATPRFGQSALVH